jgi:TetR/AcrR family transcriptional repressor of mexJK operon
VFTTDHFRLRVDDGYRINRRALHKRIDVAIATFCEDVPNTTPPS